jgi:hypothetical protein
MIKGIIALFTSGVIYNPMVLLGIIGGFAAMFTLDGKGINTLCHNPDLYFSMLALAGIYVIGFRRVINDDFRVDWPQTILRLVGNFLKLVISFFCAMMFIGMFSFDEDEIGSAPQSPEEQQVEQELRQYQQILKDNGITDENLEDVLK